MNDCNATAVVNAEMSSQHQGPSTRVARRPEKAEFLGGAE